MAESNKSFREKFKELTISKDCKERFQNYIKMGISRADYFEYLRRIYLEMNLALMSIFIAIFPLLFKNIEDNYFKISIVFGYIGFLSLTVINILFYSCVKTKFSNSKELSLLAKLKNLFNRKCNKDEELEKIRRKNSLKTENFWKTLWFYERNVPKIECFKNENVMNYFLYSFAKNFKENSDNHHKMQQELLKDDIKQIFQIYCRQSNYCRSAYRIKWISLSGLIIFIVSLIIGLLFIL
ncbi:MAG: hypothetical protein ACTSQP_22565 [Promethearchaeota archaeon]